MPLGLRSYERNGFNPTLRIVNNNQYSGHVNIIRLLALKNHFLYLNVWLIIKLPRLPAQSFFTGKETSKKEIIWFCYVNTYCALADPRGGARDARPPWGSKFFHFHAVFGKNVKNNSNFGSWRPPLGKILDPPLLWTPGPCMFNI